MHRLTRKARFSRASWPLASATRWSEGAARIARHALCLSPAVDRDDAKGNDPKIKKRADAWTSLQHAASAHDTPEAVRWYDRRYQQVDITRERVQSEASRARELATQYISGAVTKVPSSRPRS